MKKALEFKMDRLKTYLVLIPSAKSRRIFHHKASQTSANFSTSDAQSAVLSVLESVTLFSRSVIFLKQHNFKLS